MSSGSWEAVHGSPSAVALATPDGRYHWLMINCTDPLLADVAVRRAIAVGLDRRALAEVGFGAHAQPILGAPVARWSWASAPDLQGWPPDGDPRLARSMLAAAGLDAGTPLRVATPAALPIAVQQAELIAGQLRDLGFRAAVEPLAGAEWSETVRQGGRYQMAFTYWGSPINDPDDALYMGFRTGARFDLGGCGTPALDDLLEAARASVDQPQRAATYRALQVAMLDHLPLIPTIQPDVLRGVTTRLRGFVPLRNAQLRSLREAWLEPA
jgi:peptide/nickel transport system substrate-binding protein